jgi:hypothetical protein
VQVAVFGAPEQGEKETVPLKVVMSWRGKLAISPAEIDWEEPLPLPSGRGETVRISDCVEGRRIDRSRRHCRQREVWRSEGRVRRA